MTPNPTLLIRSFYNIHFSRKSVGPGIQCRIGETPVQAENNKRQAIDDKRCIENDSTWYTGKTRDRKRKVKNQGWKTTDWLVCQLVTTVPLVEKHHSGNDHSGYSYLLMSIITYQLISFKKRRQLGKSQSTYFINYHTSYNLVSNHDTLYFNKINRQ